MSTLIAAIVTIIAILIKIDYIESFDIIFFYKFCVFLNAIINFNSNYLFVSRFPPSLNYSLNFI